MELENLIALLKNRIKEAGPIYPNHDECFINEGSVGVGLSINEAKKILLYLESLDEVWEKGLTPKLK